MHRRGAKRRDDACRSGHPRTAASTYVQPDGKRICRVCRAIALKRLRAKKRKAAGLPPPVDRATTCRNGHKRTDVNTYIAASGKTVCADCETNRNLAASQGGFICKETISHVSNLRH